MERMFRIKYTNSDGEIVTSQQLQTLNDYEKTTIIDDIEEKKEIFIGNELDCILYYAQDEDLSSIINNYMNTKIHIFHNVQFINSYKKSDINTYENGILTEKAIIVEDMDGNIIFDSELELASGNYKDSKKYVYKDELDEDGKKEFRYIFNYSGNEFISIDIFSNDVLDEHTHIRAEYIENYPEYFSWVGYEEYQNIEPIMPS